MSSQTTVLEIACQQVLTDDSSVFSIQWADFPKVELSTEELLRRYLSYIKKYSLTLIRPATFASGIEFRIAGTRLSLISFLPPEFSDFFVTARISGGILLQRHRHKPGELRFGIEPSPSGLKVSIRLSDFFPLILGSSSPSPLRIWLYRRTQAAVHKHLTVSFLYSLYNEFSKASVRFQVVPVSIQSGRPV
jgi:hypothetical protein